MSSGQSTLISTLCVSPWKAIPIPVKQIITFRMVHNVVQKILNARREKELSAKFIMGEKTMLKVRLHRWTIESHRFFCFCWTVPLPYRCIPSTLSGYDPSISTKAIRCLRELQQIFTLSLRQFKSHFYSLYFGIKAEVVLVIAHVVYS